MGNRQFMEEIQIVGKHMKNDYISPIIKEMYITIVYYDENLNQYSLSEGQLGNMHLY